MLNHSVATAHRSATCPNSTAGLAVVQRSRGKAAHIVCNFSRCCSFAPMHPFGLAWGGSMSTQHEGSRDPRVPPPGTSCTRWRQTADRRVCTSLLAPPPLGLRAARGKRAISHRWNSVSCWNSYVLLKLCFLLKLLCRVEALFPVETLCPIIYIYIYIYIYNICIYKLWCGTPLPGIPPPRAERCPFCFWEVSPPAPYGPLGRAEAGVF